MHGNLDSKPKPHGKELAGGCDLQTSQSTASTKEIFGPSAEFVSEGPCLKNSKRSCLILDFFFWQLPTISSMQRCRIQSDSC